MRSLTCVMLSVAALLSGRALGQAADEADEVIVRGGKSLSEYRVELEQASDDLFNLFNELNRGRDNDVRCRNEAPTGSRMPQRVCRTHAEDRADANGAREFLNALVLGSGRSSATGEQVNAAVGMGEGLGDAIRAGSSALAQFEQEWVRVLGGSRELYEAAVEYVELKEEFDKLRGVTNSGADQPRQIALGPTGPQCEASTYTEYEQLDDVARISGTVSIAMCPAGTTGSLTLVARVRNEAGAITPLEFNETWRRGDTQDHIFNAAYPIGQNVALVSVRVRNLTCTCASPTR